MNALIFLLLLASSAIDLDMITVPVSNEIRVPLTLGGRAEIKREETVTRIRIEIDKVAFASTHGQGLNTYVVWAVSPEGFLDNLGELEPYKNGKGVFIATTRLTQFGILITAEPHYMVDRPSSAVVYRSQGSETDIRRKRVPVEVGVYDYAQLKAPSGSMPHMSVAEARSAFQIAQAVRADQLAPADFRNAQVALGSMEELVSRSAPLDILWPTANEAIRWAQRAAASARAVK